jgi:hypothetical protein
LGIKFVQGFKIVWVTHNGATILHPNTKVLVNQGLFVFSGVKNNTPFTIAPFLEPTTCDLGNILKCLRLRDIIN